MRKWRRGCGGIKTRRRQLCLREEHSGAHGKEGEMLPFFLVFGKRQSLAPNPVRRRRIEKNEVGPRGVFPLLHLTPNLTIFPSSFPPFPRSTAEILLGKHFILPSPPLSWERAGGLTDRDFCPLSPLLYFPHGRPEQH